MKRKLLVVLLSLAMLFTLTPMVAFADSEGHWDGDHYYFDWGGYAVDGIFEIDGQIYSFDSDGVLRRSTWITDENGTYYAGEDGAFLKGFQNIEESKYYFDTDNGKRYESGVNEIENKLYLMKNGVVQTDGWATYTDEWNTTYYYYADEDGVLSTGWTVIEGDTYYFDLTNGHMYRNGRFDIGENTYLFDENGILLNNSWDSSHTHYYDENGTPAYGLTPIDDKWYYFDEEDGTLRTGLFTYGEIGNYYRVYLADDETGELYEGWQNIGSDRYYFQTYDSNEPFRAFIGIMEDGEDAYYFSENGILQYDLFEQPYYITVDGEEVIGGYDHYYADESGKLLTGWQVVDDDKYYFSPEYYFAFADGTYTIDGESYTFNEDGVLVETPSYEPVLVPVTLWEECQYQSSPHIDNVDEDELEVLSVTTSDPEVIDVECYGEEDRLDSYILFPHLPGTAVITVAFNYNGEYYTLSEEYTVKLFPQFLDGVTIDGEAQDDEAYTEVNYYDIYEYTGTQSTIKLDAADGWYLDFAYGFLDGEDEYENLDIDEEEIGSGWAIDFPEEYDDLYTFFYFRDEETDEEIMYSIRLHRGEEDEDPGDEPYIPAEGHWDESHTHYYYEYGYMATGVSCIKEDGAFKLYYFDENNGTLKTGWIKETGTWEDDDTGETGTWTNWYYGDPSTGVLATGWKKVGNNWYYFTQPDLSEGWDGYLPTMHDYGTEKLPDGKWYYLTPGTGIMATGWIQDKHTYTDEDGHTDTWTNWYYADKYGIVQSGWLKYNNNWYYLEEREDYEYGSMYTGNRSVKGKSYLFSQSGIMQSGGWVKDSGSWTDAKGNKHAWTDWYYADKNGVLAEGWKKLGGKWYYFAKGGYEPEHDDYWAGGYMYNNNVYGIDNKLYAFNANGTLQEGGWVKLEKEYYYYDGNYEKRTYWAYTNSSGIAQTGWQKLSGVWYCFDNWGYMLANQWAQDSKGMWWMESNGKLSTATKWVKYNDEWYHITKGYMDRNKWMKDSKGWCWLQEDGSMLTNGWAKDSKGMCWIAADGYMPVATKWVLYEGEWYYIEKGYMVTNKWKQDSKGWCYVGDDGIMVKNGFVPDTKGQCWIGPDGYMIVATGWLIDYYDECEYNYYLEDGYMAVSKTLEINGETYVFDADGYWTIAESDENGYFD